MAFSTKVCIYKYGYIFCNDSIFRNKIEIAKISIRESYSVDSISGAGECIVNETSLIPMYLKLLSHRHYSAHLLY